MREQQTEIDALVLNLNPSLIPGGSSGTSAQLDALFAVLSGDFNGDHSVDTRDYVAWRKTYGQHVTAWSGADGNGDSYINDGDYTVWRSNFGATGPATALGESSEVPEPPCVMVALIASIGAGAARNKRWT